MFPKKNRSWETWWNWKVWATWSAFSSDANTMMARAFDTETCNRSRCSCLMSKNKGEMKRSKYINKGNNPLNVLQGSSGIHLILNWFKLSTYDWKIKEENNKDVKWPSLNQPVSEDSHSCIWQMSPWSQIPALLYPSPFPPCLFLQVRQPLRHQHFCLLLLIVSKENPTIKKIIS